MVEDETREAVGKLIAEQSPRPAELLEILGAELSYSEVQDAIAELVDSGRVVLDSDLRLRVKNDTAA